MIDIYPDSTLITFSDGSEDTLRLCQEHEITHIALCHWLGIDRPTMTLLREGDDDRLHYLNRLEECAVLSIQHLARAAGVDLLARMKEWSQKTK